MQSVRERLNSKHMELGQYLIMYLLHSKQNSFTHLALVQGLSTKRMNESMIRYLMVSNYLTVPIRFQSMKLILESVGECKYFVKTKKIVFPKCK